MKQGDRADKATGDDLEVDGSEGKFYLTSPNSLLTDLLEEMTD